jgi:hypothetical protein
LVLVLLPAIAIAQNYVLQKDVLSAGGRKMTSSSYILQGTISQTAIGRVTDTDYKGVIGFWHPPEPFPPDAPYVKPAEKSGSDVTLTWEMITSDTLGNPETVYYYIVYRNTSPSFVPGTSDSIGYTVQPDTTYTDAGALSTTSDYYYLVKAVDVSRNRSGKSNMGYKLNKVVINNPSASDRNWFSLPWHSEYSNVSALTTDLSPSGDPLIRVTDLRNDQLYQNWLWDPDFLEWGGVNFSIASGRGYEAEAMDTDTLILVGSNNPNGHIPLVYNVTSSDRNWVAIPYNAVYATVSGITSEYAPAGDPIIRVTDLRNDQLYQNWIWDPDFVEWGGVNFTISPGRGYEFEVGVTHDTTWDPTEFSNESKQVLLARGRKPTVDVRCGALTEPDRTPVWKIDDEATEGSPLAISSVVDYADADAYAPVPETKKTIPAFREAGESHVVRTYIDCKGCGNVAFTAYRVSIPHDVITENLIGSGIMRKDDRCAIWFDTGNFMQPWQSGEEVVLVVETADEDCAYYNVTTFVLRDDFGTQDLGKLILDRVPQPEYRSAAYNDSWDGIENQHVIGYSLYRDTKRINDKIITRESFASTNDAALRPVVKGGFETVYNSDGVQGDEPQVYSPIAYAFATFPNPFVKKTCVQYSIPHATDVNIHVYDICGRKVKTLVSGKCDPGHYMTNWFGDDDHGRNAAAGVYFVQINTRGFESREKLVLIR